MFKSTQKLFSRSKQTFSQGRCASGASLGLILIISAFFVLGGVGCIQIDFSGEGTGNDGGVFRSVDKGAEWTQKVNVLTTSERVKTMGNIDVLSLAMDPQDNKALYLGSENNGLYYSYDGGESWSRAPTLQRGDIPSIAVSPNQKCTIYAAYENKVIKSIDCSRSWKVIYFESRTENKIIALSIDSNNPSIIYAGSSTGDVLKSNDAGSSWTPIGRFKNPIEKILIAPYDSAIVYVATANKGIFKTTNGGGSWDELLKNFSEFKGSSSYQDIQFDLSAKESLIYGSKYGLLKTADGGQTWQAIELLTPPSSALIYSLGINPKNGNDIFYSTATTFYRTLDGGNKWITKKLPTSRACFVILIDPVNSNIMYMGVRRIK